MLIWLGKQLLGQSDRQSTLLGQEPESPAIQIVLARRDEEPAP